MTKRYVLLISFIPTLLRLYIYIYHIVFHDGTIYIIIKLYIIYIYTTMRWMKRFLYPYDIFI